MATAHPDRNPEPKRPVFSPAACDHNTEIIIGATTMFCILCEDTATRPNTWLGTPWPGSRTERHIRGNIPGMWVKWAEPTVLHINHKPTTQ